jgi:hypothetical protein
MSDEAIKVPLSETGPNPSLFSHEDAWCQRSTHCRYLEISVSRAWRSEKGTAPCQITMDLSRDRPESGQVKQ